MKAPIAKLIGVIAVCCLLDGASASRGEDVYESLVIGTNTLKNVHVIEATPVELVLRHDGGYERLKRDDLPPSLKDKYPYDAAKAAEFKKQKLEEASQTAAAQRTDMKNALNKKEADAQAEITRLEKQDADIQKEINVTKKMPNGNGRRVQERNLATEQQGIRERVLKLKASLQQIRAQRDAIR